MIDLGAFVKERDEALLSMGFGAIAYGGLEGMCRVESGTERM